MHGGEELNRTVPAADIHRFGEHHNALGFLRLLFASLVIAAHVPEIVDGSRIREPLTLLFGTISFGDLAVDGFFIISGYLISASYLKSRSLGSYLLKRVARIYPAFILAFLLCTFVVAPIAGGDLTDRGGRTVAAALARMFIFGSPYVPGTFAGTPSDSLNGAMWTIGYEFKCYLLVILLGRCGLLGRPARLALLAALGLAAAALIPASLNAAAMRLPAHPELWLGRPNEIGRLFGMFLAGSAFHALRGRLSFDPRYILLAAVGLVAGLCVDWAAEPAIALFGPYLIFAAARVRRLQGINDANDVSYGIYLYAWPVTRLLLLAFPAINLAGLMVATWLLAWGCGWLSWHLLEKPVMARIRPAGQRAPSAPPGSTPPA